MNKKNGFRQLSAILLLLLIGCTLISLMICLIKNASSGVILAHLFCLMIIPCMFYALRLFTNTLKKRKESAREKKSS